MADQFEAHIPDVPLPRYAPPDEGPPGGLFVEDSMPFDIVVGRFNPLALPVRLSAGAAESARPCHIPRGLRRSTGMRARRSLAAAFDIVFSAANSIAGVNGPTVRLNLRYRRPTLIGEDMLFEGWVTETTERRVFSKGHIIQGGITTVEAEAEFAVLDRTQLDAMAAGRRAAFDHAARPATD